MILIIVITMNDVIPQLSFYFLLHCVVDYVADDAALSLESAPSIVPEAKSQH